MSFVPCPCKDWGKCDGKDKKGEWFEFAVHNIIPCKVQVIWMLSGADFAVEGGSGSQHILPHARFVPQCDLWAELEYRLGRTGRDGETLVHEVVMLHVSQLRDLSDVARDALNYVAGSRRKRTTYSRWLAQRERRREALRLHQNGQRASSEAIVL